MKPEAQFENICDELKVQMASHLYEAVRLFAERYAPVSSYTPAVGETLPIYLQARIAELEGYVSDHAKEKQKHLDHGTPEREYWHYGYMMALKDVAKKSAVHESASSYTPTAYELGRQEGLESAATVADNLSVLYSKGKGTVGWDSGYTFCAERCAKEIRALKDTPLPESATTESAQASAIAVEEARGK